jgi:hypothetical protein
MSRRCRYFADGADRIGGGPFKRGRQRAVPAAVVTQFGCLRAIANKATFSPPLNSPTGSGDGPIIRAWGMRVTSAFRKCFAEGWFAVY